MFEGFTPEAVEFLWGIKFNNSREWFLPRKEQFLALVDRPMRALGSELFDAIAAEYPRQSMRLHVCRIYRDARRLFGRGPYKDHLWFCVRAGGEDWTGRPTFYFEIGPDYYSYGMGFWQAPAELMEAFRRDLQAHPAKFEKLVRGFEKQDVFTLNGDSYARSRGEISDRLRPWFQKKSITLSHELPLDEKIFHPELAGEILENFKMLVPFYKHFVYQ